MTAALPQQTAFDDGGTTLILAMENQTLSQISQKTHSQSQPQLSPPPLPQRNARRSSRFLDALLLDSTSSGGSRDTKTPSVATESSVSIAVPIMSASAHDLYLSSEEDASSMGDLSDFEDGDVDYAYDSDSVEIVESPIVLAAPTATAKTVATASREDDVIMPTRRHSHEDTARLVSVVFAGKPSLVDLALERAARRRSLNDRSTSPSPSASSAVSSAPSLAPSTSASCATRPSTSAGSIPSTAPSSTAASPQRQHKRNSSGSMLASFRARKMAMDMSAPAPLAPLAPLSAQSRSFTGSSVSTTTAVTTAPSSSSDAASSPRTPTFGHGNLLRGMTRSLTLSRRNKQQQQLNKEFAQAAPSLPAQLPGVGAPADTSNIHRKSLALSLVSSVTATTLQAPDEPMYTTGPPPVRRASTSASLLLSVPSPTVLSKKNGNGNGNSTGFFGRRRSIKLL